MKKWLVAVALVLGVLLIAGVLVVNSLDLGDILGGSCFCGDGGASWSPDGKLIVYAHNDRERDTHLYTISPDGGKPKRVTDDGDDEGPVWSPGGTKLALVHSETDQPDSLDVSPSYVQVMDADGGDTRILGNEAGVGLLRWSPNGRSVAYLGEDDALHVSDSEGRSDVTIELGESEDVSFDWSADGRRLVYSNGGQIYFATADGRLRWKDFKSRAVGFVDWSPDGSHLAFATEKGVYAMDVGGRRLKKLGAASSSYPAWSRDGTRLAWVEDGVIVIAEPDGSKRQKLVLRGGYPVGSPEWSPDGKQLIVPADPAQGNYDDGETKLFIVPLTHPKRAHQLT
jgi:Tol biopolymer transport system component